MELRQLRYFVAVADILHFGRAAERLGMSQPPLSQQIRTLENELGVRLFDRTSRKVALTEPGRLFLDEARATLAQAARAVDLVRRSAKGDIGRLRLGLSPAAPFVPDVARAIFEFSKAFPDVRIDLVELSSAAQIAALDTGDLDVAFLRDAGTPVLPEGVCATRILQERLHVGMRPDHPLASKTSLSFQDLQGERMIVYAEEQKGGFTEQLMTVLRSAGVKPTIVQDVTEVSTLFGLIAAGLGLTVLAESMCALQHAKLTYRPLRGNQALSAMWMGRQRRPASPFGSQLLEIFRRGAIEQNAAAG